MYKIIKNLIKTFKQEKQYQKQTESEITQYYDDYVKVPLQKETNKDNAIQIMNTFKIQIQHIAAKNRSSLPSGHYKRLFWYKAAGLSISAISFSITIALFFYMLVKLPDLTSTEKTILHGIFWPIFTIGVIAGLSTLYPDNKAVIFNWDQYQASKTNTPSENTTLIQTP